MNELPEYVRKFWEVIQMAGVMLDYEERQAFIKDNTELLRNSSIAMLDDMKCGRVSIDETFCALNAAKSVASSHELLRHEAHMSGLDTIAFLDAVVSPIDVAQFLNKRQHDTTIITFHFLTENRLAIFAARNGGKRKGYGGIVGYGNILYGLSYMVGLKDEFKFSLETNTNKVLGGNFSFESIRKDLQFLGAHILSLLLNPHAPTEVIFLPDRLINFLPLHAIPIRNGEYIHDYVKVMSYSTSLCELIFSGQLAFNEFKRKNKKGRSPKLIAIKDDTSNLKWLEFEKNNLNVIKQQLRSQNIKVLVKKVITEFDEDFSDCIWLSWSAHGRTSMRGWQYSYLEISGSKVTADIIKDWTLYSRPVVILAACETALDGNINQGWEDYYGIDMAFRIAGAKTVIGTLWAVPDTLAALTTYLLASWFISGQVTPDRGLTSMQGMLRKGRWKQFLLKSEQLSKLPKEVRINIQELQESLWNLPNELFTTPECWAVFRCLGR